MFRLVTSQFEEFEDSLRGVQGRFVLRSRQQFNWVLRIVELNGVCLSVVRAGAAHFYNGAGSADQFTFFVLLDQHEDFTLDGVRFDRLSAGWLIPEKSFHVCARHPPSALSVTVPRDIVTSWLSCQRAGSNDTLLCRNSVKMAGHAVAEFVRVAHRIFAWDKDSAIGGCRPATEKEVRQSLLDAVFAALAPIKDPRAVARPMKRRLSALECALAQMESKSDEPPNLLNLSRRAGVSERTLRNVFQRNFSISPHRYLMLEKLHEARAALRAARPGDTVSSICANLGIWDAGRFAARYRHIFGVLPSQDLAMHRPGPADSYQTARFQAH